MGLRGSKAKAVRDAGSWSETRAKVIKCSHAWTLKNFSVLYAEDVLESSSFHAKGYEDIKWRITMYPRGSRKRNEDWMGILLCSEHSGKTEVRAEYKISLLDAKYREIDSMQMFGREYARSDSCGARSAFRNRQVFAHLKKRASDQLIVLCEVSFAFEIASDSSQNYQTHSDVLPKAKGKQFIADKAILAGR